MRANLPDAAALLDSKIPDRPDLRLVSLLGTGNNGHVFRARSESLQRDLACKIVPVANLVGEGGVDSWRQEIEKANALRSETVIRIHQLIRWRNDALGLNAVVFISDYVEGWSLRDFIRTKKALVDVALINSFLRAMFDLLNEMKSRGIEHGDLHEGNILVEDRSYALAGPRVAFRVTDFGVDRITSEPHHRDDYIQLAEVLKKLLQCVKYQNASPRDKYIYNTLNNEFLARHLVEQDPTRDTLARNPKGMFERLEGLQFAFDIENGEESAGLITPFDFLSCEQIGDAPTILKALYSEQFLGLEEIETRNNTIVTGPRGCGKSTVFKCLSLRHRVRVGDADPDNVKYIGVYYRCDDLYFAFPRYRTPDRKEALDLPCHFITATLLTDLLDVSESWTRTYFPNEFATSEFAAATKLWDVLGVEIPPQPGAETFRALRSELAKQRIRAAKKAKFGNDPKQDFGGYFGADVLARACEALSRSFDCLKNRPFYFFIDDYSSPKITQALQQNLNRVFMQRLPFSFFKLSTESPVSFIRGDIDEKVYVEGREFILHNLGLVYLHAESVQKLVFIEDVFRRRLSAPRKGYPVSEVEQLVGSNADQNNNDDARRLRESKKLELWGKEVLARLCSGDIHYLIQLIRDMVVAVGGESALRNRESTPKIQRKEQNKAIREAAGIFLKNLRGIPQHGDKVVAIVTAFGTVARSYLQFLDSQNEKGNPPHQATRIEPYESIALSGEAQDLYNELLRYSVFIEDFRGKSRRGKVVPRLYMRRFLIPHFNLTFSTRDSISLEPDDFKLFLLDPAAFEQKFRIKSSDQAAKVRKELSAKKMRRKQMSLLDDEGQ